MAVMAAAPALADPVILNGGFEMVTPAKSTEFGTLYAGQVVSNWTSSGYNFVFLPGTADTSGASNQYNQQLKLWGPGIKDVNGNSLSNNGLPASSPVGGNFIAADGAYLAGPIQQKITGLSPNSVVQISFYYAGAQQYGFDGVTTEGWRVSLGNETHDTVILTNDSHGFTGWRQATLSFVVTSAAETLSFLALGTPSGAPPFTLLDGVSITQVPEPGSLGLVGAVLGAIGVMTRRRKRMAA